MYTDDARQVRSGCAEARQNGCTRDAVGIEHLLLALIEYGRGPVEEAFFAIGITPARSRLSSNREENAWDPTARAEPIETSHTPGTSHALGLILDEASPHGHDYIGS